MNANQKNNKKLSKVFYLQSYQ